MKPHLLQLVLVFSFRTASSFPQSASPSPTLTTATCSLAICTWNAFGPKIYPRPVEQPRDDGRHQQDSNDRPTVFSDSFTVQNIATQYKLHISADERVRRAPRAKARLILNGLRPD